MIKAIDLLEMSPVIAAIKDDAGLKRCLGTECQVVFILYVIAIKDYIKNPKPNGYRSYHLIIEIPVFFSEEKKNLRVEVQIRTIAMDFWASLDHQLKYKKDIGAAADEISEDLRQCAEVIAATDQHMLQIRKSIEEQSTKQHK